MPEIVISDTSCLILLTKINELELLQKIYQKIWVTDTIAQEYQQSLPAWISVKPVTNKAVQQTLEQLVDAGEASAFALALEFPESLLIVDDRTAKRVARSLNLRTTGTLGIIIQAKNRGLIASVKPILTKIVSTDFRISQNIVDQVLELAGEK